MSDDFEAARTAIQAALNEHMSGMTIGFAIVVESLSESGEAAITVLHTPMAPWHLTGLLQYAQDEAHVPLEYRDEDFGD